MTHTPPPTFSSLLEQLKQDASSARNQGDRLEYFVQEFLRKDPVQSAQFKNVWLWSDWPGNNGERDNGIDLVAERHDGTLVAIQSKFFGENTEISQASISSFVARVRSGRFSSGILVSTTDRISSTAENLMGENPDIPILHLDYSYFSSAAIDWDSYLRNKEERGQAALSRAPQKELRDHQQKAISKVLEGFESADRGKLIMACGTGKTFTALKLAEAFSERSEDSHTTVLFMVPSLALMSQSIAEFSAECSLPLRIFAVCSDTKVGRAKTSEDMPPENIADLKIPATTDGATLFAGWEKSEIDEGLTVVFATYQSIAAVAEAQKLGLPDFDLIICDEAHRTTGATLVGQSESHFVRIHDNAHVAGAKRLYMTATPRIYNENAKSSASEKDAVLVSMDDTSIYGDTFHTVNFGEAISLGLLTDYKVLVFGVSEEQVSAGFQGVLADQNRELKVDDVAKLVGAYNALAKRNVNDSTHDFGADPFPMKRAVAFSRSIKDSKKITADFPHVADQIRDLDNEDPTDDLSIEVKHIDGGFGALERGKLLDWLKEDVTPETPNCRILSNARCLTEGVDVPNLDAVMFLNPRNSMVDIIQAVGRVMRKAPGKKYGYIVLPVVVPAGATAESSLDSNESYKTIWKVVQALRAHDERLGNDLELARLENRNPQNIIVDFVDLSPASSGQKNSIGSPGDESEDSSIENDKHLDGVQQSLVFPVEEWKQAINTKVVEKCGDRLYWQDWSKDIADIARKNIELIRGMLDSAEDGAPVVLAFERFVADLQAMLNPTIDEGQAIELLAQHLITQPIFAAMFAGHRFTMENPVSQAMQAILEILNENAAFERETEGLEKFYAGVEARIAEVNSAAAKQNIIKELYDHFFRVAFPKTADRLGIVFTPVEVVDYILRSADVALQKHFGKCLSDRGVSILEPFAGTGTFITRLLQLGLIRTEDLVYKFTREIYANELVLLSYYIAAINVESVFAEVASERGLELDYVPFEGMVLTDTFQLTESASQLSNESVFAANSLRAQKELDAGIQVIVMNPPYSAGQESANDNNQNLKYPELDASIARTYAAKSSGTNLNSLYDSYIRAIRWATDRIADNGVIAFVSNGSFIDGNAADGLRKSLVEEFSDIYIFNLRGNQRTSGEASRREGGKIFGSGSRTPVAICVLVKQADHHQPATLHYHDIGDYLTRDEKLNIISGFTSIEGTDWENIVPNDSGDWINQRDERYDTFQPLGDKKTKGKAETPGVFQWYSRGLATSRDAWCYNHSTEKLTAAMKGMIDFYNQQLSQAEPDYDATKISWNRQLLKDRERSVVHTFRADSVRVSFYRPFDKQIAYFDRNMNDMIYQLPKLFPTPKHQNLAFITSLTGAKTLSLLVTEILPDLHLIGDSQVFALYYYEPVPEGELALSVGDDVVVDGYYRRDNITDATLKTYRAFYEDASITKEDIFYYIYALLHHPDYRETYRADLMKMLPRIPKVEGFSDYARIGRELAELHLTYESVSPYPLAEIEAGFAPPGLEAQYDYYRVEKLKFGRGKDKSTIIVNSNLTLEGIPEDAYGYEVNGRSAIEWLIDRYQVKTDKKSQITNDPNDWCREVGDPRYIVDLIKRIVTVSLETNRLVEALPGLVILEN